MNEKVVAMRDGIFALHTVRFGTVAELMVQKIYDMIDSPINNYDKVKDGRKIEIKFSRVLKSNSKRITLDNVLEQCILAPLTSRIMKASEAENKEFDCNIQQIKPSEFDDLYYGLFFQDKIEIYKITNAQVLDLPEYSDKQHRGNQNEGQFHLNNKNIANHRANFLVHTLNYQELYNLFS